MNPAIDTQLKVSKLIFFFIILYFIINFIFCFYLSRLCKNNVLHYMHMQKSFSDISFIENLRCQYLIAKFVFNKIFVRWAIAVDKVKREKLEASFSKMSNEQGRTAQMKSDNIKRKNERNKLTNWIGHKAETFFRVQNIVQNIKIP